MSKEDILTDAFIHEAMNHDLLKADEEWRLARRIQRGKKARKKLMESNLRLVASIAKKYINKCGCLSYWDLIQEGVLGLIRASDGFDAEKECRFATYAVPWIEVFISRAISKNPAMLSLDQSMQVSNGEEDFSLYKMVEDKKISEPSEEFQRKLLKKSLRDIILSKLDSEEQKIIALSFGLQDGEICSEKRIAALMQLSMQKIRQKKKSALQKLKRRIIGDSAYS